MLLDRWEKNSREFLDLLRLIDYSSDSRESLAFVLQRVPSTSDSFIIRGYFCRSPHTSDQTSWTSNVSWQLRNIGGWIIAEFQSQRCFEVIGTHSVRRHLLERSFLSLAPCDWAALALKNLSLSRSPWKCLKTFFLHIKSATLQISVFSCSTAIATECASGFALGAVLLYLSDWIYLVKKCLRLDWEKFAGDDDEVLWKDSLFKEVIW